MKLNVSMVDAQVDIHDILAATFAAFEAAIKRASAA